MNIPLTKQIGLLVNVIPTGWLVMQLTSLVLWQRQRWVVTEFWGWLKVSRGRGKSWLT